MTCGWVSAQTIETLDFSSPERTLEWRIINDTVMGGRSTSRLLIEQEKLVFQGDLNTDGGGFASLRSSRADWDLRNARIVRLRVRGDGRSYRFRCFTSEERITYQSSFTTNPLEWLVIELPLKDFTASWRGRRLNRPPLDPAAITSVGLIIADGTDGVFQIEVDQIEFLH